MRRSPYKTDQLPWREGNCFTLLVNGDEIFPVMLEAIDNAKARIFFEMYLVESGVLMSRFITSLVDAAERNVAVYLLFDAFGALKLREQDRASLMRDGIHCVYYNPLRFNKLQRNLLRDHRKLLVVDDRLAFVGGVGITDEFDYQANPRYYWHDVVVRIEGPNVVDWVTAFRSTWKYWTRESLPSPDRSLQGVVDYSGQLGRVTNDKRFGRSKILRDFIRHVLGAEHQVWMMTAYFVPSGRLRRALRRAARRGVDVRLLLPGRISDHPSVRYVGRRYYHALLRAGVRIFEYQPRFLHGKILLCDDWVSLGSSNLDSWNLRWNLEANQEIDDAAFADRTRALFEMDFLVSEECHFDSWQRRSPYHRLLEWFWGSVDRLVERVSEILQR